jgi:hypothetical protein
MTTKTAAVPPSKKNVIIWISASYLEHIPMTLMKCRPPYLSYKPHILSGGVPLKLTFSERVVEVRVSPKFFKILRILLKYYHVIMTMGMY